MHIESENYDFLMYTLNVGPPVPSLASFPDSPYVAYIVLTFELAHTKSTAESVRLKVNTIYARYEGRVWERGYAIPIYPVLPYWVIAFLRLRCVHYNIIILKNMKKCVYK